MNNKYDMMETLRTIKNDPELTASQKYFLVTCVMSADNKTGKVKNSQENLAHYAQINFKTVSKWLNKHPEVMKYFISKKRGRMLDLWFVPVTLEVSLHDTRPSKMREELDNTPSEMEYSEDDESNTPPEMEEQTVTDELQSDTPSEIPNTPSEVEPSTSSSTLSSTNAPAAQDFVDDSLAKEDDDISLVVIDDASPLLEVNDAVPSLPVVEVTPGDDVEKDAPAASEDEHDDDYWLNYDPFDEPAKVVLEIEKPSGNGGVPDNIMNILNNSDNVEEAVRLYLDPEFRADRAEDDEMRAAWARDYAYQPKNAMAVTNSHDDEW